MKNIKITISDVAEALNISTVSVSRALSGQAGVSEDLRTIILKKAQEMGYLKTKKNDDINILILHKKPYTQDNSNFSFKVQGIEKALQKAGAEYSVEFVDKESQDYCYLPYKLSRGTFFDGVIFIGRFNTAYTNFINEKIKNIVFYTGYSPSCTKDCVLFNFNNSGYKQCEYLIKRGHKNIGFIENKTVFRNKEKLIGITTALEDYGISVKEEFFLSVDDQFEEKIFNMIQQKSLPTAMICESDLTALTFYKLLFEKNIKVPQDISIIGSGNTEISALSIPTLTTMDLNIPYSCEVAVSLLLKRIHYPDKPYETIAVNSDLIERTSVQSI